VYLEPWMAVNGGGLAWAPFRRSHGSIIER
jgi:hypothetical protein